MAERQSSYRPHNPGHDYHAPGIYLITLVVRNRHANQELLGHLNNDIKTPEVIHTEIGNAVLEEWEKTSAIQKKRGNELTLVNQVCMPDHWHGVVQVHAMMNKSLGHIIQYVKSSCTARWRAITGSQLDSSSSQAIRGMSEKQRKQYYENQPLTQQPLWDDDYDDTICLSDPKTGEFCQRHFKAMVRYVNDNALRAIFRRLHPQYMQRCLHVRIADQDYAAFGNLFLLRWARKVQVFCHRLARKGMLTDEEWQAATANDTFIHRFEEHARNHKLGRFDINWHHTSNPESVTAIDYTRTAHYRTRHSEWIAQVLNGATVIVTPGISSGEKQMKNECLEQGYPLIHLQKEAIGPYWKPEESRFKACVNGSLLILAPWKADELGTINNVPSGADYTIFHNLNKLAEEICMFEGEAAIKSQPNQK